MRQNLSKEEKEILSETPEEAIQRILFWKDFKPVFRPVDQIKPKSLPNQTHDSVTKSSGD